MKILKKITVALFVFLILLTITTFQTVYAYQGADEQSAIELTETDFIDLFDSNNNQFKINDYPNLYGEGFVIHNHYFKEIPQEPDPENPDEPIEPIYEKTPRFPVTIYHDDPIVKIIPKKELTETGQKLKIGREYGYFVDTHRESHYLISTVLVFDVTTNTDLLNNNDQISVTVMPLYQYEVVAVSKSYTSFERKFTNRNETYIFEYEISFDDYWGVFAYPSISSNSTITTFTITFGPTEKYFLKDISFGATMYNENELNREDIGYNPYNDNGAFFIGAYYEYEGSVYSSGSYEAGMFVLDAIHTGIGYVKKVPPLSVAAFIWDVVDLAISFNNAVQNHDTFDSIQNNANSIGLQVYNITKPHQIANYGQLQKMLSLVVNTDDSGAIFRNSQFAKASYMINNTNPTGLPDYTRFYSNIGLSISDKYGNKIMTDIASHDFYFGDETIKTVDINDYTQISLLPGGQKVLEFTPNHSGYYYFDTNGTQNTELEISGSSITEVQVLRDTNKKIRAHLKAGVTYKIVSSYEDDEYAGIFFLNIYNESFDMGNSNVTIHSNSYGGDLYRFEPSKTSSYEFSASNSNVYFAILDEDYNQIFGNSTNNLQAFLSSGSIYYLLVKNKTSSHYTTNISFTEVTSLQLNTNTIVVSNGNEKYMRFKPNSSGYYSILIDNYGGDIEYNVLNTSYTVSNASGAIVLDLYIEANQEIIIRIRTSNSLRINISNSQNSYKWEVNGVIQTNNSILLNRGTTTTIRLKFGDYYITNIYPIPSDTNSYSFANNKLTIYSNGVINERIVLHAINDNSPIYLFVYIGHTFSDAPFDIYNGEDFYGLRWKYVSGINSTDLSLVINIQGTNYDYPIIYGFNASSGNIDLNSFVSARGGSVVQDVKITLKWMRINGVTIYNTNWSGYSGLSETQKRQNISVSEKTVNNYFLGGSGTSANPYTLSNFRHLNSIRYLTSTSGKHLKMTNNIFVPNVNDYNRYDIYWNMISTPFYGTFDGNGYSIHKISLVYTSTINSNKTNFGLFEINHGTIKNLTIKESGASSQTSRINSPNTIYVGMIAGRNYGNIINCHYNVSEYQNYTISMAIFNKNQFTGGLVGYNNGVIRDSTFNGTLLGHGNVGGIVGYNDYNGILEGNKSYGEVNVRYNNDMLDEPIHYSGGGIASVNYGTIKNNVNYANIEFYCANYFESRVLQPRIGQIIGTNYGVQQNNILSGLIYKWQLKTISWETGIWPFRKTNYHYQDLYVGGAVGYQT